MQRSQQIMEAAEALLAKQGYDVKADDRLPDNPGLNMLIPLQEDGTELVLTELHFIPGGMDFDVVQIYTTLIGELHEPARREVEKAVAVWNQDFLLGALAVGEEGGPLYHRYCLALPKQLDPAQLATLIYQAFSFILSQIAEYHPDALTLASGVTFDDLCAMD